jgi:predicted CoA-substrate-specific enzyme activase
MLWRVGMDIGAETLKTVMIREDGTMEERPILRVQAQPLQRTREALQEVCEQLHREGDPDPQVYLGLTGSGGAAAARWIGADAVEEPVALTAALNRCYPDVRTLIEMGREGQKYLLFARDERTGRLIMTDCNLGDKCAAGSGAFLDHMAVRLNFDDIAEFARVALQTERPASLSGRCSVFTESDIVHLYQKGTSRERIAAGIHQAICRNYRARFARGKPFPARVAFIGGVSENPAAVKYLSQELNLNGSLFVPPYNRTLGAIGAALRAQTPVRLADALAKLEAQLQLPFHYEGTGPLRAAPSESLAPPPQDDLPKRIALAALGVDIGSVSTKAALVTEHAGRLYVLASHYRKTNGDPLAAVRDTLEHIYREIREKGFLLDQVIAATTGSGRYLTADYIGADLIKNEITAQASGTLAFLPDVETILEIGGQDSKYIRLDAGVVTDFEMNRACAAGCGAFLEKQAARLGIPVADFGDCALRATNPPPMDWTCTVFTESAMVFFQQAGVAIEDLCAAVCLASARNYLHKNVGGREIGQRVVFQGAVAFNRGMVAAFETLLGRRIVVPPYPHLTGAIGAARLALRNPAERPRFRGFERIAEGGYTVGSFECRGCANACDVNTFQMTDGPKYFYNDRCEKFSALCRDAAKPKTGRDLPDLFEERERMLFAVYEKKAPPGAKRVGVPRGLMFCEYFPLYNAFLTELGFQVVPSDPTNKEIIRQGLTTALGEPCFPYKVAHGHYINLLEKGVDYLFTPGVISTEQPDPGYHKSLTCPYLQAAPELLATNTGVFERAVPCITTRIHFNRGRRHLVRVFSQMAEQLGKTPFEARQALEVGLQTLERFRAWQQQRGQEILDSLGPEEVAFVVVGRPYVLYDPAVNAHISKKIRDLGILPIPQDFLPLTEERVSDSWPNVASRQIQRKLAAARIIRRDRRLRAVVLTYFGCGPDSFANPFFRDELGEPCYVMQIDEHTADAGVVTRIEAFSDTATAHKTPVQHAPIRTDARLFTQMEGRRLWIPYVCDGTHLFAAVLRAYGVNASVLPRSTDPNLSRARAAIAEDVCLPALMTTEDILCRAAAPDFDPASEAFFMAASDGPCRFGMYSILQRRLLDRLGLPQTDIASMGFRSRDGGLGTLFALTAWDALVAGDLLHRMLCRTRPYEIEAGAADTVYQRYLQELIALIPALKARMTDGVHPVLSYLDTGYLEPVEILLHRAQEAFRRVPKRDERRPMVGVVGEFYVRLHEGSNQDVLRKIERHGGEAWLAPATEFFAYAARIGEYNACHRWMDTFRRRHLQDYLRCALNYRLACRDEHVLFHTVEGMLEEYPDISAEEVIAKGAAFLHPDFGSEAVCSLGKAADFAERGVAGVIAVRPFNCMPGNIVQAFSNEFRRRYENLPFLNLDYDGFLDSSRDMKIANFMWQVKERWAAASAPGRRL